MGKSKVIHAMAYCATCKKGWEDYKTARANGRRHANNTGHRVTGEVGHAFEY